MSFLCGAAVVGTLLSGCGAGAADAPPCPGCGSSSASGGASFTGSGGAFTASGGNGGVLGGTGSTVGVSGGGGSFDTCLAEVRRGERVPLDMFVIWDRSGSMDDDVNGGNKWELVTEAFIAFVEDPASAGIGVGIGYFPLFVDGVSDDDRDNDESTVCDIAAYSAAAVPIAALPANAPAIVASIEAEETDGRTPTRVALAGAVQHARQWATAHPGRKVIVVLQTDGEPNVCESSVEAVADVAADGLSGTPSLPTYVIGVGEELENLNEIAVAGGTGDAFIVDTSGDTTQQFIDAMNQIRATAAVPCEFLLPADGSSGPIDPAKVNVTLSSGASSTPLLQSLDEPTCDPEGGGWFYDSVQDGTRIRLCPASCGAVLADPTASVQIELGCATRPGIIR